MSALSLPLDLRRFQNYFLNFARVGGFHRQDSGIYPGFVNMGQPEI